ncbi:MAG: TetR/AcrR family transcriptional regulator [Ignavibacteriales bacterium]
MKSKEKIILVATDLFHKKGYQTTTVDEIAEATGVTKSNLYYHFRSKEELALETLDMRMKQFESEVILSTLGEISLSPQKRLQQFYDRVADFHSSLECRYGCPFGNLAIEMSDVSEKFRKRLSIFFRNWEKAIEKCIDEGIREGEFRRDINPKLVAQLILSQVEGAIMMVKTHKILEPLTAGAKVVLKLLEPA